MADRHAVGEIDRSVALRWEVFLSEQELALAAADRAPRALLQRLVADDDEDVSAARLYLAEATMQVLRNTLHLLGVSAPHSM